MASHKEAILRSSGQVLGQAWSSFLPRMARWQEGLRQNVPTGQRVASRYVMRQVVWRSRHRSPAPSLRLGTTLARLSWLSAQSQPAYEQLQSPTHATRCSEYDMIIVGSAGCSTVHQRVPAARSNPRMRAGEGSSHPGLCTAGRAHRNCANVLGPHRNVTSTTAAVVVRARLRGS